MTTAILQLCPLLPDLETALQQRFTVHRWFEIEQRQEWLGAHAGAIRGVVTGGHLGIPNALADQLPALEIVAINGVGFDKVDLAYAKARGLGVTNTPDVLTDDVADLAIGLVIALLRRIAVGRPLVRAGRWPEAEVPPRPQDTRPQRFGIFGLGRIGKAIGRGSRASACPSPTPTLRHRWTCPTVSTRAHRTRPCGGRAHRGSRRPATATRRPRHARCAGARGHARQRRPRRARRRGGAGRGAAGGRLGGAALDVFAVSHTCPRPVVDAQCRADSAHRQRHHRHPPRDGRTRAGQPRRPLQRPTAAHGRGLSALLDCPCRLPNCRDSRSEAQLRNGPW